MLTSPLNIVCPSHSVASVWAVTVDKTCDNSVDKKLQVTSICHQWNIVRPVYLCCDSILYFMSYTKFTDENEHFNTEVIVYDVCTLASFTLIFNRLPHKYISSKTTFATLANHSHGTSQSWSIAWMFLFICIRKVSVAFRLSFKNLPLNARSLIQAHADIRKSYNTDTFVFYWLVNYVRACSCEL